jgi:putative PIN family toxin of toxin-antitoxin system
MIAAVFDCMVFLQAATNDTGPAFACLSLVESNHVHLYVSPAIPTEIQDVLSRPKIRAKFPHLTQDRVDLLLLKLTTVAVLVSDIPDAGMLVRDPNDLPYLNLAIAANVACLVSWDKDLRDLMKDSSLLSRCPQLSIVDPVAFLNIVRSTEPA